MTIWTGDPDDQRRADRRGFANAVCAQQMFGGHGYIVETGMEQFVRDARITMLYEGANGIQALDLVARKHLVTAAAPSSAFRRGQRQGLEDHARTNTSKPFFAPLELSLLEICQTRRRPALMQQAATDLNEAIAGSTDYMHLFGLVALGYMWLAWSRPPGTRLQRGNGPPTSRPNS